ncbi:MAG: apolipoprotein A1/A4/E family protein [Alistipes sp.]|nr:apolipoprotein A1/A4/E family protein [Alistipes senegalensis]MCM1251034.1 apolipoprotein A1/A4/E family protein [Alistipes sp.]
MKRLLCSLFAVLAFAGCSLLKVSVSSGDPLPRRDAETRLLTRGFYYDMSSDVARTADSIVAAAPELSVRLAAVRWKIRVTRAAVSAAMQSIPDVSLADMWILCRRMDRTFAAAPDSLLFGAQTCLARATAAQLDRRIGELARQALSGERYDLMEEFVVRFVSEHPVTEQGVEPANTTLAWIEFLREKGVEADFATGSISEVLADVNDRLSGQTQQLVNSVGWSKDLLEMEWGQDSLRSEVGARLDSLERDLDRMVRVAEHLPEISDRMMEGLNEQVAQLVGTMNSLVDNAFSDFGRQRRELQVYVTQEREALVEQLRSTAGELVSATLDAVPGLIGRIVLYVVLALVVLIGGPFALGFWLGGVRQRAKSRY